MELIFTCLKCGIETVVDSEIVTEKDYRCGVCSKTFTRALEAACEATRKEEGFRPTLDGLTSYSKR